MCHGLWVGPGEDGLGESKSPKQTRGRGETPFPDVRVRPSPQTRELIMDTWGLDRFVEVGSPAPSVCTPRCPLAPTVSLGRSRVLQLRLGLSGTLGVGRPGKETQSLGRTPQTPDKREVVPDGRSTPLPLPDEDSDAPV